MIPTLLSTYVDPTIVVNKTPEEQQLQASIPLTDVYFYNHQKVKTFRPQYLVTIYPEDLNQLSMAKGITFRYHILSKSLHFWIEIVETQKPVDIKKLCKERVRDIKNILYSKNHFFFKFWADRLENQTQYQIYKKNEKEFKPPGKTVRTFQKAGKKFQITHMSGDDKFQLLLVFLIDGASSIDSTQGAWQYYIVYQIDQEKERHFVGALSKYSFWLTTEKKKDRISQIAVLPFYQNLGVGREIISQVYGDCIANERCSEITVQSPSIEFECLRLFIQTELVIKSGAFTSESFSDFPLTTSSDIRKLITLYTSQKNIDLIKNKIKIPASQVQKIAQILIYARIKASNDEMLEAHFSQYLRQNILKELMDGDFEERKAPCLFYMNENIRQKDYNEIQNIMNTKIKGSQEIGEKLGEILDIYRRVEAKLGREGLLGKDSLKKQEGQEKKGETQENKEKGDERSDSPK